jgi:exodeoxyribonuclease-5
MRLTSEQRHVLSEVVRLPKGEITIGGRAGTGKTTVIRHLAGLLPRFAVCAYTGKAVNVLRGKGVEARTIHSLIYKAYTDDEGKVYFSLARDLDCEGIIVDEASMVGRSIYEDLRNFRVPLVFVGDHGQLEPVGDDFNLMREPDHRLETIHRNAGEIAHFADYVRQGYRPSSWGVRNGSSDKISFLPRGRWRDVAPVADQAICAYNKTRAEINTTVRSIAGRGVGPEPGDRVMCLRNDSRLGLFNGMQGVISSIYAGDFMEFEHEGGACEVQFDPNVFGQVKYDFEGGRDAPMPFDYSYAATCHKCQGSEWDSVLVLEQKCDLWDHRRWAYTAASRAREKVYWCES